MNAVEMDSAETANFGQNGSVAWSIPKDSASDVADDDRGDYPKLDDRAVELKQARSAVDSAIPCLVWPVFIISVVVGASSAAVILKMKRAAPISLAGWRHQVSSLALLPFFLFEWNRLPKIERSKAHSNNTLGLYLASSLAISGHFAFYLWSLEHTSMAHCLFLACMSPIFVAIYTKLSGGELMTGEVVGVVLGLAGVGVLAAGTRIESDQQSTYLGDFVALLASVAMAVYLIVGKRLRSWMPLFVYQFPVVVISMIILGTVGLLWEGWNDNPAVGDISGLFGWLRKEYIVGTLLLAIGPGFIGHAGYSFVLKYSSPLVMPTGLSLQPIIGSALGWAVGVSPIPGLWTCLGGVVTLSGTLFVTCASANRTAQSENKEEEYKQPATDEEGQQATKPLLQS